MSSVRTAIHHRWPLGLPLRQGPLDTWLLRHVMNALGRGIAAAAYVSMVLAGFYLLSANNVGWATCTASWMVRYYNGSSR